MNPHAPRKGKIAGLLAFAVLSGVVFAYLFALAGGRVDVGGGTYELTVTLPEGFALEQNAEVRAAGVPVGRVESIGSSGSKAVVRLRLEDEIAPVHANAQARLRTRTLVGENYVELSPGGPPSPELPSGGELEPSRSDETVQFDQILSTLDPTTRRAVSENLRALGAGVGDGADVNAIFDGLEGTAGNGASVVDAVHADRRELARVIERTGTVLDAISSRERVLRGLITGAKRASEAAASRDRQLRATVRGLPSALRTATATVGTLERLSLTGSPAVKSLDRALVTLNPAVDELGPTARDARLLIDRIPALAGDLRPLLGSLEGFSVGSRPAVRSLRPALAQIDPGVDHLRRYAPEFGSLVSNIGAFVSGKDERSWLARVQLMFDQRTLTNLLPPAAGEAADALTSTGVLGILPGTDANPYPEPGTLDSPRPLEGPYPLIGGPPGG